MCPFNPVDISGIFERNVVRVLQVKVDCLAVERGGAVLVAAGMTVSLDGMVSGISLGGGGTASAVGIGGMLGLLQSMLSLLAQLDDLMRIFGGLALAFGAVVLAVYLWSRERVLVVSVAGGDDIELTASRNAVGFYERLGYERVREVSHETSGGVELDCLLMRKELSA